MGLVGFWKAGSLHHHLGGQGHHRHVPVALGQGVVQALLDVVADIPLAHGTADVKGHGGHHVLGGLAGQDDPAHLGTVAVDHRHFIAGAADVGDALAGVAHHFQLGLGGGFAVLGLQGVPAQGDDDSGIAIHRDSSLAGEHVSMLSVPGFRNAMRRRNVPRQVGFPAFWHPRGGANRKKVGLCTNAQKVVPILPESLWETLRRIGGRELTVLGKTVIINAKCV